MDGWMDGAKCDSVFQESSGSPRLLTSDKQIPIEPFLMSRDSSQSIPTRFKKQMDKDKHRVGEQMNKLSFSPAFLSRLMREFGNAQKLHSSIDRIKEQVSGNL